MIAQNYYINAVRRRFNSYINQRRGWRTKRHIIVFESDDWGSVRMPDRVTYEKMLKAGIRVDMSHYNKYDTLASNDDFKSLFEVLLKYKDKNGNNPVITANTIVANPDFAKIKESNFEQYYYEPFTETLKRYENRNLDSWLEGLNKRLFFPQLHGREHLNVELWMRYLKKPSQEVRFAFDNGLYGIGPAISLEKNPSFVQAFDSNIYFKDQNYETILKDAVKIFRQVFGYESKSFISPNYYWDDNVENITSNIGIEYLQGMIRQNTTNGFKYNYLGKINPNRQYYLIRNINFEPSSDENKDWVSETLKDIEQSFKLHKPAVISMHRVNLVGSIFENNRTKNLKLLDTLLRKVTKQWADVEFLNTVELGELIKRDLNK